MRKTFARVLADIADKDDRVFLLTADLGYHVLEEFIERHPDKYLNVGVAECAMVGMATGMAREGFVPYCYSIATFAVFRPFEFIRNGPVEHDLPVRIVGAGRLDEYGHAGQTHWPFGAVNALGAIGLKCYAPMDNSHLETSLEYWHSINSEPFFLSLSKA